MKNFLILFMLVASSYSVGSAKFEFAAQPAIWSENGQLYYAKSKLKFNLLDNTLILKDAVMPSFSCEKSSTWRCISNSYLNFALKKEWAALPDKWEYEGFTYEKVSTEDIMILGDSYKTQVVVVKEKDNESHVWNIVYYSKQNGVLMFHVYDGESDQLSTFISTSKKGLFPM